MRPTASRASRTCPEARLALVGAAFDPHDGRVTPMFGDPAEPTAHLARDCPGGVRGRAHERLWA
jgi:hypothetical protein